ncbi:unnamed protein product [Rhizophagus irregularis]|nr:unnamed protein product [Rhizophagus irregularis]
MNDSALGWLLKNGKNQVSFGVSGGLPSSEERKKLRFVRWTSKDRKTKIRFGFQFFKRWIYGFGLRFLGVEYTGSAFGSWALDTDFFRFLGVWIYRFRLSVGLWIYGFRLSVLGFWIYGFRLLIGLWIYGFRLSNSAFGSWVWIYGFQLSVLGLWMYVNNFG